MYSQQYWVTYENFVSSGLSLAKMKSQNLCCSAILLFSLSFSWRETVVRVWRQISLIYHNSLRGTVAFRRGSTLKENAPARNRANYVNKQLLNAFDFCSLRLLVALTMNLIQKISCAR